jgi:hypothetical protein
MKSAKSTAKKSTAKKDLDIEAQIEVKNETKRTRKKKSDPVPVPVPDPVIDTAQSEKPKRTRKTKAVPKEDLTEDPKIDSSLIIVNEIPKSLGLIKCSKMLSYLLSIDVGTVNMAFCLLKISSLKIQNWGLMNIKNYTYHGMISKLNIALNQLDLFNGLTDRVEIVLEQSMSKNLKTVLISGALMMYFEKEYCTSDDPVRKNIITKIDTYHAKNKINYYIPRPGDEPMPMERINALKKGHYKTKVILKEHCKRIMIHTNQDQKWFDLFNNKSKQDDLADSFVQGLSYIKMKKLT